MRFNFDFPFGRLKEAIQEDRSAIAESATAATRRTTADLQATVRQQVRAAGLGIGLEKAWQKVDWPRRSSSLRPAGMVWSKATALHAAYERGGTISARGGRWLAIPTDFAIRKGWGQGPLDRMGGQVPAGRLRSYARTKAATDALGGLRFVALGPGRALLVWDNPQAKRRSRGKVRAGFELPRGDRGIPVFVLVRVVRVQKLLDFEAAAKRADVQFNGLLRAAIEGG